MGNDIAETDGDRLSGSRHTPYRDESLALRRSEPIDLVLDRQHGDVMRHQAKRRLPARAIQYRGDDANMQKPVLLSEIRAIRQRNFHDAWLDTAERRADRLHRSLPGEARSDTCFELRI